MNAETNSSRPPQVIGFAAYSGTGKTTLLKQVIPELKAAGIRLAVIKHSHHDFTIDQPGKDSYELHQAGSQQTLITSKFRSALVSENSSGAEPNLSDEINKLDLAMIDLVVVEGFRHTPGLKKIELHRCALGKPLLLRDDPDIIALAIDGNSDVNLTTLDLNQPQQITQLILRGLSKLAFSYPVNT